MSPEEYAKRGPRYDASGTERRETITFPAEKVWTEDDPAYYRGELEGFDLIDVIAAFHLDFDLGCAAKYIFRAGRKPGADFLVDLRKAKRVLERRIEREEKAELQRRIRCAGEALTPSSERGIQCHDPRPPYHVWKPR